MEKSELLEEEIEMINTFKHELKEFGHEGYCSFDNEVENGYYIFKEDDIWAYDFNKKGITTVSKRFTNLYNLFEDILNEMKIDTFYFEQRDLKMPKGTRVVITKPTDCPNDELNMGVIVGSNLEKKEYGQSERVYQVFGDDGRLYTGLYGFKIFSDVCFRTIEDYIIDIEKQKKDNMTSIQELIDMNGELILIEEELLGEKDKYLNKSLFKK